MHVMIATDGSEASHAALAAAAETFGTDVDYTVVSIGAPVAVSSITPFGLAPALMAIVADESAPAVDAYSRAEGVAADAVTELEASNIDDVEMIVEVGGPASTICRLAAERAVDVLVIGAHSRGWLSRLIRPSIAHELVDDAPCHVLVVRHDED